MSQISQNVLDLSEVIAKGLEIDAKTGATTVEEGLFEKSLPEGMTADQVSKVHEHEAVFAQAAVHALGTKACDVIKKHKELETVTAEFPMSGKDHLNVSVKREQTFPVPGSSGEKTTKYGHVQVAYKADAMRNVGQMKKVMEDVSDLFEAACKK
jgi:hypothetical protein